MANVSIDEFDEESDYIANLEAIINETYNLVENCNKAADIDEDQYFDTIAELYDLLKMSADELMKINTNNPPSHLYRKASNIRISLVRHKSKASAELHRREIQNRIQQLELSQKEAALANPPKLPTPEEQAAVAAAAAAAAEKEKAEEAQFTANLAEWRKKYDDALRHYKRACAEYDQRRDTLATIVLQGKGCFFADKKSRPDNVVACVEEYLAARRQQETHSPAPPK